jgi:hypothetical protein
MQNYRLDENGKFLIEDYQRVCPFSSFLPGIAGPLGVPLCFFYVNRGQAIASFGVENKDNPIVEFQPANHAYQLTSILGFRIFSVLNIKPDWCCMNHLRVVQLSRKWLSELMN